ncbi:MAG: V-type ATP synthase subunit E [Nitrosopumilaceae archaeon]|nr:V-type ATP synthase subunit E [Nitrosopumilaceae archaeon]NIT99890.1 V-type ATP synthase subunit E [Nitrosopumilaceae archaeon]NIU86244.1 V-type ATP synthase subunit E [Nitrosopumilaceae archaeon]NIV64999.1 V-type ATP synthase subunit E [Nitrosopumilaceae archaeon]NIX60493.1 V-type ATP synthase subunit E [Nitrosopumilaceae archaeon]
MRKSQPLASKVALEQTIDKVLEKTESEILTGLKDSLEEAKTKLDNSQSKLEQEYDEILADGKKEADKIEKQLTGTSDLEARNKQLMLIEGSVDKVFDKAIEKIGNAVRNEDYSKLISYLLENAIKILGTSDVIVYTNSKDYDVVNSIIDEYSDADLASEKIDCLGGIKIKSKDGSMTFDNTIDARIERMKPLIRKEIATKFGIGS